MSRNHAVAVLIVGIAGFGLWNGVDAQTEPNQDMQDTMVVTGVVPIPAGGQVRVEALDPVTMQGVECTRTRTAADERAGTDASRFTLTVNRACFEGLAANLRVCWAVAACAPITFEPGKAIDIGRLEAEFFMPSPPEVGSGFPDTAGREGGGLSSRGLTVAGFALLALGVVAIAGHVGVRFVRSRRAVS